MVQLEKFNGIMKKCLTVLCLIALGVMDSYGQQDPQYTQYMYNTQIVNPAYAGNRGVLSFGALYRTQWVGFDGAPKTGTFTVNAPIGGLDQMGLGLSIVSDKLGPATESNVNVDWAYALQVSEKGRLSFGVKGGIDILDVDYSLLDILDPTDEVFQNNIDNRLQPQIGAGVYYNTDKFYVGLSVPNFLETKHFDESDLQNISAESIASERMHYFFITGYVFDLSENLKFKPATMVKVVSGSPVQWDVSANFLINDKFTLGGAYRWSAALSALVGFQASDGIFIGFGYDYQTTDLEKYSDGSYEIMLRFDVFNNPERVVAPRFF